MQKSKPEPQPITVEATLLWIHPDRFTAMCAKGFLYHWITKTTKQQGFSLQEGDMVFVHTDLVTREVYSMTPQNAQAPASGALGTA